MSVKEKRIIFVVLFCSLILCLSGCSLHHKKAPPVPAKKVNFIGLKDASGRSFRLKSPRKGSCPCLCVPMKSYWVWWNLPESAL